MAFLQLFSVNLSVCLSVCQSHDSYALIWHPQEGLCQHVCLDVCLSGRLFFWTSVCLDVCLYLSTSLSCRFCQSIVRLIACMPVYVSLSQSVCLSFRLFFDISVYHAFSFSVSVFLSISLTICLSVWLYVCLIDCMSVCLPMCLSACQSNVSILSIKRKQTLTGEEYSFKIITW